MSGEFEGRKLEGGARCAIMIVALAALGVVACSSEATAGPDTSTADGGTSATGNGNGGNGGNGGAGGGSGGGGQTADAGGPATCAAGCGKDQVCSNGTCTDLPKTCPCPIESYCDLSTSACKVGCTANEECSQGRFCDVGTRTCKDGCRTEADCSSPANGSVACNQGTCNATCDAKFHACGKSCKSDTDATACGASCTVCPTRANAVASCTTGACKSACESGFHDCSGACASNTAVTSCGASCTACASTAHGQATCDGTACGIKCDSGYVPSGATCVLACESSGCSGFNYCDSASHLCKSGCTHHSQCGSSQFCRADTHTCENAAAGTQGGCPMGFKSIGTCSDWHDLCVNQYLPANTTYPFSTACPAGSTSRGVVSCSGPTYVCVVDN
jgi:hypothetical protein